MMLRPIRHPFTSLVVALLVTAASACAPAAISRPAESGAAAPAAAPAPVYPGAVWERAADPESLGWSSAGLDAVRDRLEEMSSTALMAVAGGRVIFEYGDVDTVSYLASVRKSILSMLYGNYVDAGTIDLDRTLADLGIDDHQALSEEEKQATVRDLISARSGVYHPASNSGDDLEHAPERGSQPPGTYYLYSNWDFNAAGAAFEMMTGRDIYDALRTDLAEPLGMQDFDITRHRKGGDLTRSRYPSYHMHLSTRDMARIGYLMLREGAWKGEQLVPRDWVRESTRPVTRRSEMNPAHRRDGRWGYGYLWWVFDDPDQHPAYDGAYVGLGAVGQHILVVPALDLVVVHKTVPGEGRRVSHDEFMQVADMIVAAYRGPVPGSGAGTAGAAPPPALARQVEVVRTAYGVPHIRAENLRAAGYAMGYVQMEDYGYAVVRRLIAARGEMGLHFGRDSIGDDFENRLDFRRAQETYHLLDQETRDLMEGFASGVNRYIELHPGELPPTISPDFTGHHVHALGIGTVRPGAPRGLLARLRSEDPSTASPAGAEGGSEGDPEDGSNAWAIGPGRTESGAAILLRNPHLSWTAGYYEAHLTVPGVVDFYGDFRIGGPLGIVGGFNRHLGWATTNNSPDLEEVYELRADPTRADHYLFDGGSIPLTSEVVTVEYRDGDGIGLETRTFWSSPLGPVVHRDADRIYVVRAAGRGGHRMDEQFLRMMRAESFEEWRDAVRMRARTSSNLTYADADGNIFYVWNATVPALPHLSGGDTLAIPATSSSQIWTRAVAFDSLPQLLNPPGGYVRNENDPPYFTNPRQPLDPARYPANIRENGLRLRSQHSIALLDGEETVSLEDVVRMKHSMRMLLADRVKADLVEAVRAQGPGQEIASAIAHIEEWDNTAAAESRGGVLFQIWWERYLDTAPRAPRSAASVGFEAEADALFKEPWTEDRPLDTPRGLADREQAADAFTWAVAETARRYGSWDVAWGDVHRVRRGEVDLPVGGCSGLLGCFRVLSFREAEDGKLVAVGGDGWILAVEFTRPVRAYSVLAYGQSNRADSPHFDDQAEMFARNRMKPVAFTPEDVDRQAIRRYRPGLETSGDDRAAASPAPGPL